MLTFAFRAFSGILGVLGAFNIVVLVLSGVINTYSSFEIRAVGTLSEALAIFGVGAGIFVLSGGGVRTVH
ncbi:MAG: hypothetical protein Q8L66_13805 [Caulobacter sp.]|nr:hypothetical protein [Caulobacter sp.]